MTVYVCVHHPLVPGVLTPRCAGDELGFIEVVLNSNTLAGIVAASASADGSTGLSRKFNAAMKVFSKDLVYREWLLMQGVRVCAPVCRCMRRRA